MAAAPKKSTVPTPVVLPKLEIRQASITLQGDSPLIVHNWSEKAKRQMREKQQKIAQTAREAKDPEADYQSSLYRHPDGGYGFPAVAFKSAAVDACSHVDGITKVEARGAFHIHGDLVRIEGEPVRREDLVKISMGTADLRYRGEFREWRCRIDLSYNANVLSLEQIANLFRTAGFAIGVGEWRPERNGSNGRFHVA